MDGKRVAVCNEWMVSVNLAFIVAAFGIVLAGRNLELSANVAKKVAANSATANGVIKTVIAAIETAIMKYGVPVAMSANVVAIALAGIAVVYDNDSLVHREWLVFWRHPGQRFECRRSNGSGSIRGERFACGRESGGDDEATSRAGARKIQRYSSDDS